MEFSDKEIARAKTNIDPIYWSEDDNVIDYGLQRLVWAVLEQEMRSVLSGNTNA